MQPRTKLEKQVVELSSKLKPLDSDYLEYGKPKLFYKYATPHYTKGTCLECGETINENLRGLKKTTCKCSKETLRVAKINYASTYGYVVVLDAYQGFQVIRYIQLEHFISKGSPARYSSFECAQEWISEKGKVVALSSNTAGNYYYGGKYFIKEPIEVKSGIGINNFIIHPKKKITPLLKRNGVKSNLHKINPTLLFKLLLSNNRAETLFKANQYGLLKDMASSSLGVNNINKYWSSIKICIRNNYIIENAYTWYDTLQLLNHFGKDLHSPKYVCPSDLTKLHDKLVEKKREETRRLRYLETLKEMSEFNPIYIEARQKYFHLRFTEGPITITPIQSVYQLKEESDALKHCAFENRYHDKENSLLLSAHVNNTAIETIEVSLERMKIIQARGFNNEASKYNSVIVDLVKKNINQIKKAYRKKENIPKIAV